MTTVFLDTVGLIALWDIADQWHVGAEQAFLQLQSRNATLVTSTFVLLECGNSAARRPYRDEPDDLRAALERSGGLVTPTENDWQAAWREYRNWLEMGRVSSTAFHLSSCAVWVSTKF